MEKDIKEVIAKAKAGLGRKSIKAVVDYYESAFARLAAFDKTQREPCRVQFWTHAEGDHGVTIYEDSTDEILGEECHGTDPIDALNLALDKAGAP